MNEILEQIKSLGVSEPDALVIADCVVTRKSCSWVNTDPVDEKLLRDLNSLIQSQNYKIKIIVDPIPTRNKYIWEVKVQ